MRFKTLTGTAIAAAALGATALPASAATIGISPSTNLHDADPVTVTWSGFTAPTFLEQCHKSITDATFDASTDCDFDTNGGVVGGPTSGTAIVHIFKGDRDLLGWACGSSVSGNPVATTCYIRMTDTNHIATKNQIEAGFTYAPDTIVPEVPMAVLIPMGAIAAFGMGMVISRRRRFVAA